jgi:hypothetical protein
MTPRGPRCSSSQCPLQCRAGDDHAPCRDAPPRLQRRQREGDDRLGRRWRGGGEDRRRSIRRHRPTGGGGCGLPLLPLPKPPWCSGSMIDGAAWCFHSIAVVVHGVVPARGYYSLQYNRFRAFFGINAADFGIYPFGQGINLGRFTPLYCSTVGLYRSYANHSATSPIILHLFISEADTPLLLLD